jgi:TPR repeat protein
MKRRGVCTLAVGIYLWFFSLKAFAEAVPHLVARAKPAVLQVRALDAQGNPLQTGTAFFIRNDGTAVTNFHIVKGAACIVALSDAGVSYPCERVVSNPPGADLAILKFSTVDDVPYLTLGNTVKAREGQRVFLISNPKALLDKVSVGLIVAFGPDHSAVQISAPVTPESSGAPVLTEDGNVIGVAFYKLVNGRLLSFAIASEEIQKAAQTAVQAVPAMPTQVYVPALAAGPHLYAQERVRYQAAAAAGNPAAMVNLGWLYQNGLGVSQDYRQARTWYEKAAATGQPMGMNNLGWLYQNGWGVPRDYGKARDWYLKAAATGNALAMDNLGYLCESGLGGAQDYAEARAWYEKGARAGNGYALNHLGALYHDGCGVAQDYAKAFQLYESAAGTGNAWAMTNLGWLYQYGRGVTQDYVQARAWYEKAAAAGNGPAKTIFG